MGPLLALGVSLARRGPLAVIAIVIAALTTLALAALAAAFAMRTTESPVHDVPLLASSALAWGGGFLLAVGASVGALRRDRLEGIRHLFATRASERGYLFARVGGLAALLAIVVGGGTLLIGLVAIGSAAHVHALPRTLQATFAAVVFATAYAFVLAPVTLAAVGSRARASGYLTLVLVVFAPELLAQALGGIVPSEVTELFALPSTLAALRESLSPGSVDLLRTLRALVALAIFVVVAGLVVRREAARVAEEA